MSIANELGLLRKAVGHTQAQLALAAGLSRMSVQRIEAGQIDPRLSTVLEMARALGVEPMLVPAELKSDVEAFLRSSGRVLGQPAGAGAPASIADTLHRRGEP